jgi:hypothetical protein
MMGKAMFLHITVAGNQPFMAIGADASTLQTSWHIIHVYHPAFRILRP